MSTDQELQFFGQSAEKIRERLQDKPNKDLVPLLRVNSVKVGDTAASILWQRKEAQYVAEAILNSEIKNKVGKIRAAYVMGSDPFGDKVDSALLFLVRDRNEEVAGNALFKIVTLRLMSLKGELEVIIARKDTTAELKRRIQLALEALQKGDPRIYNPNYAS